MTTTLHDEIAALTTDEKLKLIEEIWSLIDDDDIELSDELKAELDRRLNARGQNRENDLTWDEAKHEILK
jgi:putative addiction module component (TIGR02574 family)